MRPQPDKTASAATRLPRATDPDTRMYAQTGGPLVMNELVILGATREHRVGEVLAPYYKLEPGHKYDTHLALCGYTTGIPTISLGELPPCLVCERNAA